MFGECAQHFRPDGRMSSAILRQAFWSHVELEADPAHLGPLPGGHPGQRRRWPGGTCFRVVRSVVRQKLKFPILLLSKTNGSPNRTVAPAPTLNSPSLPALKVSPSLPVIVPSAKALPAYAARKPRSSGFQSANWATVPSSTYLRI